MIKNTAFNACQVLIDTWWNVNNHTPALLPPSGQVLIDTWWNVNDTLRAFTSASVGFNRYMVECEYDIYLVLPNL